ncbi:nitrate/nitrite transporter [Chloroflexota bacterium]
MKTGSQINVRGSGVNYGWVILVVEFILAITLYGLSFSFGVFFKSLEAEFNISRAATSAIFSGFLLLSPIFGIPGGWLLDRYNPKIVFILIGIFMGASLLVTSRATEAWHLFVGYSFLMAVSNGPTFTAIMSMPSRWFEEKRGMALGIAGSGINAGILIMTPVSAYLITVFGWRPSYFILAIVAFCVVIPLSFLMRHPPDSGQTLKLQAEPIINEQTNRFNGMSLGQAIRTQKMWMFISLFTLMSVAAYIIMGHLARHAIDLGISDVIAASLFSVIGGMGILARMLLGPLSDNIGRKNTVLIAIVSQVIAMSIILRATELWQLYVFSVFFGFSFGGFGTTIVAYLSDTFGTRHLGKIIAVADAGWNVCGAAGPAIAGLLYDTTGTYFYAFLLGGLTSLIALVITALSKPVNRQITT